jgi:bifunctional isochorismate lyase/aryl carrier protein
MVADGLADFSRDEHLMALRYTAGRCGRVVMTEDLVGAKGESISLEQLRREILPLLDEDSEDLDNDDNLIDYGLDSVRIMALATRWRKIREDIDFVALAKMPTLNGWFKLLSGEKA